MKYRITIIQTNKFRNGDDFMKKILLGIILASLLCTVAFAEEAIPNLAGKWEGTSLSLLHTKSGGFQTSEVATIIVIKEQKGRLFYGEKTWTVNGKEYKEDFSGVITVDNKHFYFADHINGYVVGDIVSEDKIVNYYIECGQEAKSIFIELKRVK